MVKWSRGESNSRPLECHAVRGGPQRPRPCASVQEFEGSTPAPRMVADGRASCDRPRTAPGGGGPGARTVGACGRRNRSVRASRSAVRRCRRCVPWRGRLRSRLDDGHQLGQPRRRQRAGHLVGTHAGTGTAASSCPLTSRSLRHTVATEPVCSISSDASIPTTSSPRPSRCHPESSARIPLCGSYRPRRSPTSTAT
jgi:hypothetical protein